MAAVAESQRILVLGAGGHGQVVADILLRARDAGQEVMPLGYLDDSPAAQDRIYLGLPVLGRLDDLRRVPHDAVVIAIGDNRVRRVLFEHLRAEGELFYTARHPSAVVAPDAVIGAGCMLCAGSVVCPGSILGCNVIVNTCSSVDHHNQIGDHVHIAPGVHLGGQVNIAEGVLIGIGSTVMPRKQIGAWSVVGAGAVVTADVPADTVVVGVPARPLTFKGPSLS